MKNKPTKKDLLERAENVRFETHASSLLNEAMNDYQSQQPILLQDDLRGAEKAWGVLANQFVGHEKF